MRFKVEFETSKEFLLLDYRRKFVSFLKNALEDYSQDIYKEMYEKGNEPKGFCSSIYFLPEVDIAKEGITLHSKRLVASFSTYDLLIGVHLINAFLLKRNKWSSLADTGNELKVLSVVKLPERPITSNKLSFKTLSPIVIRDHDKNTCQDWYLTFEDDNFEKVWKRNLKTELQASLGRDVSADVDALKFEPIKLKKTVVLNYDIYIPCTIGSFFVKGEKYLLEYLYKAGLGSRRSLSFGCLEIL